MRNKGVITTIVSIGFLLSILAGCSGGESDTTKQTENSEQKLDETLVATGEKIAKSNCIGCHGSDLSGDLGPDLRNTPLTKEQIVQVLIKGGKTMPPASANGNEEAVAEYLLTLK